jgi:hypothetical protein
MCERAKDGMVEAVVQYLSSSTPHDDLLSLPNTVRENDSTNPIVLHLK